MIPTEEADKSPNICIRIFQRLFNVAGFREVPGSFVPRVKRFFNILSMEPFMTIYISVGCVGRPSELVTDTCGRGKVCTREKRAPGSSIKCLCVLLMKLLVVFTLSLICRVELNASR